MSTEILDALAFSASFGLGLVAMFFATLLLAVASWGCDAHLRDDDRGNGGEL